MSSATLNYHHRERERHNQQEQEETESDTDDLISFLHSKLEVFDRMRTVSMVEAAFEPVLKQSPNITNINEIYQDESSTLSTTSRSHLNYNVSTNTISEEPELEDEDMSPLTMDSQSFLQHSIDRNDINSISIPMDPLYRSSSIVSTATNATTPIDPKVRTTAKQIFNQNYAEITIDKYTAFLGTSNPLNIAICKELMKFFYPWPKSLIDALRKLCSKLYLTGESVQIDQVLEIFAQSWSKSYPKNPIGDFKAVHIVCFAILILNSDLHNEQNLESKFTKDEFVNNTWDALKEDVSVKSSSKETIDPILRGLFDSIASEELELLQIGQQPTSTKLKKKNSLRKFSGSSTRSSSHSSKYDSLSNISIRSNRNSRRLSSIGSTMTLPLSREPTNLTDPMDINLYDVSYQKDQYDDKLEILGSPWMIEGLLKSESNSPTTNRKSKKNNWFSRLTHTNMISSELDIYNLKDWRQCIVIIQKGLLKQYSFGSISDRKQFSKTKSDRFVNTVLTYNLYSATASLVDDQIISNSQNKNNGVAWVLTIPNLLSNDYNEDKKVVYYAPSLEIANNFIDTCNFWAARITSIPSTEDKIVTNAEFGWGFEVLTDHSLNLENIDLTKWECLLSIESSFIPSAFKLEDQFDQMNSYVQYLEKAMEDHNELNPILKRVWGSKEALKEKFDLVMTSWSEKYVHLYRQHQKYKIYLDSLGLAISFRASKI